MAGVVVDEERPAENATAITNSAVTTIARRPINVPVAAFLDLSDMVTLITCLSNKNNRSGESIVVAALFSHKIVAG